MAKSGQRCLFVAVAALMATAPAVSCGSDRLPRVGFCSPGIPEAELVNYAHPIPQALLAGMRERGWHHEKNYRLVFRTAVGRPGGMPACIDSLVKEPVDVVVTFDVKLALERVGRIPVVAIIETGEAGILEATRAPHRNITGVLRDQSEELWHKQLALFKELGNLGRIVSLSPWHPAPDVQAGLRPEKPEALRAAERAVAVAIERWRLTSPDQIAEACATIARHPRSGIMIGDSAVWVTWGRGARQTLVEHCVDRHRIPIMYAGSGLKGSGVLISYGPSFNSMLRLLPYFIDRVLKGAKPGDLPVQRVEDYQLGLNVGIARKLGITIPQSLLLQADIVMDGEKVLQETAKSVPY